LFGGAILTEIVTKRINLDQKVYEVAIRRYNPEQLGNLFAHFISLDEVFNKESYISTIIRILYPAYENKDLSRMPEDMTQILYKSAIEVNPKLKYEQVYNFVKNKLISPQQETKSAAQNEIKPQNDKNPKEFDFMKVISKTDFSELEQKISYEVQGQEQAISELLAPLIATKHKGWPKDCISTSYLLGPSGVGKTSSIDVLAHILGAPCQKFKGSEYMESHTKQNLIGAPSSYVGYEQGGILTNFLAENPQGVFFFDETDKAHIDVLTTLHCFLGDGYAADSKGVEYPQDKNGNTVKFKGFFYFTSNTGNKLSESGMGRSVGFGVDEGKTGEQIEKQRIIRILEEQGLQTAFLNRISQFVRFNELAPATLKSILNKQLDEQNESLKYFTVNLTEDASNQLLALGRPKDYGARNIAKNLDKCVVWPLCYEFEMHQAFPEKSIIQVDFNQGSFLYKSDKKRILEKSVHDFGF
jgi:ATP-dependent Clp protease ATP-binding subunit ClpA